MRELSIDSPNPYSIYFNDDEDLTLFDLDEVSKYQNIYLIYDGKVKDNKLFDELLKSNKISSAFELEISEAKKNLSTVEEVLDFFDENNIERQTSLVIALGGGVLLDLVGFACSIYMRGVAAFYIPTTLLSMVDASIGSKTGVDYSGKKNMLGTFSDPIAVWIDQRYLDTLERRELNSGIAEVIKIALLDDLSLFEYLEKTTVEDVDYVNVIYRAVSLKKNFIEQDYLDEGRRQFLNFGHTFGHAIESYYDFNNYTHGEAISIGMIMGYPSERLVSILKKFVLPTSLESGFDTEKMYELMKYDKKNKGEVIRIVTLKDIGSPEFDTITSPNQLQEKIEVVIEDENK